ncbi:hypothetical protein SLW70_00265 [Flavobacterium sp. NG2]|uniref:hypothetical protein n=1 Tax=Flavobacterium sp. NG2 TaxID=3097547 RepID=UPI002A824A0F|nr:hypothetical protein [Flavobacterium sp. NG2]WPR71592.1 hypothetical protein SLW70_00265 [Flavobacterium sp. NG2]
MDHRLKTSIFKILSVLPDNLGYFLYHFLQDIGSKQTLGDKIKSTKHTYDTILGILQKNNLSLKGMKIAELGSGWVPILPYLLILEGKAKEIVTYDVNEHYNVNEIKKVNDFYRKYEDFEIKKNEKYPLHEAVCYFPKKDICKGDLEDVDLIVSRFVLEHVLPIDIKKMHGYFSSNLKTGSYVLHLISPSDHRAYSDSALSLQDFLKYSETEWDKIQTKFDYHNRLRLPQYLAIFEKEFDIVFVEHDRIDANSVAYSKFKALVIHDDFKVFSEQELMAGSINVLLRKK